MSKAKSKKKSTKKKDVSPSEERVAAISENPEELARVALEDPKIHDEIEEKLRQLSPEKIEMFVRILELTMKKRRIMLRGYIGALISIAIGTATAVYLYANANNDEFIAWVFLIPLLSAGLILYLSGKWVKAIKK